MSEFERIVRVRPAYDCLVIQPCVHGSARCGTDPGANHGRHNAEMHMVLRGPVAEIILIVGTGWDLPETPVRVRHSDDAPRPHGVGFHSSVPMYDGQVAQGSQCDLWSTCYGNVGYTMADEPTELLVRKGSDAVWQWLEAQYCAYFGAQSGQDAAP